VGATRVKMITINKCECFHLQSKGLGVNAATSKNTSVELENDAENQKKRIPELRNWLERLEELIKQIRDNFDKANSTLTEVKKPFPRFEDLTSMLGKCFYVLHPYVLFSYQS
jgi:chromosome segregation ATPase